MQLILVRHALPVRIEGSTGAADPPLSEDGQAQAQRCGEYLATEDIDAIYASPLLRARQTAEPLAELRGVEIQIADGVAEYDQLSNEYIPAEELKASGDPRWADLLAGKLGADAAEFTARVETTLDEIVAAHRGQRVAVFCHGGVINVYLSRVLGLDYSPPGFFYPNYTSIHRVAASSRGDRTLLTLNETAHLRGSGLPIGLFVD